jgi:hypothetical protein
MATKRADARAHVRLPTAIANSPHAEAIKLLGDELRAAAAKASGLPVEGFTVKIELAPPARRRRRGARLRTMGALSLREGMRQRSRSFN